MIRPGSVASVRFHWLRAWLITLPVGVLIVASLPAFFSWIDSRPGMLPPEPLLGLLPAWDLSVPLFVLLYLCIITYAVALARHRFRLLRGLQAYLVLLLLRMLSMALVTLKPPPGMVLLHDPVIQWFYPGAEPFTKDLFFSGHVATVCLMAFVAPWSRIRPWLWGMAVLVALAVLVQHVHWTVDVAAAPVFAWMAWRASALVFRITTGLDERHCHSFGPL